MAPRKPTSRTRKPKPRARKPRAAEPLQIVRASAVPIGGNQSHDDYLKKQREHMASKRAAAAEIEIPPVADPARRAFGLSSLRNFGETYFREDTGKDPLFYLPSSDDQLETMDHMEHVIRFGGYQAEAKPRGRAKTTRFIVASAWATLAGLKQFAGVLGQSQPKSYEIINDVIIELTQNELLLADFPEVCVPLKAKYDAPKKTIRYNGDVLSLTVKADKIVFPRIKGTAANGQVIAARSIEAGTRGWRVDQKRPDLLCLDDPQTDESARSVTQQETLRKTIGKDILKTRGPGRMLSVFMLCTVIEPGDIADEFTDPDLQPAWNGSRTRAIMTFPDNMEMWEEYMELRREGMRSGKDPTGRKAHKFYLKNRKKMDKGAVVDWTEAYIRDPAPDGSQLEVSALQNIMNQWCDDGDESFYSELQNDPASAMDTAKAALMIDEKTVRGRLSSYPRDVVPAASEVLVEAIDVRGEELHYGVGAFKKDGWTGYMIDYGIIDIYPPEGDLRDPNSAIRRALQVAVLGALRARREVVRAEPYKTEGGGQIGVDLTMIDAGWLTETVKLFCRESGPRYRASMGFGRGRGRKTYNQPPRTKKGVYTEPDCPQWYGIAQEDGEPLWCLNADYWKLVVHERFQQTPDATGSFTLYGSVPETHRRFAKHITAEVYDPAQGWVERRRWNHFLDVTAMMHAGANMLGCRILDAPVARPSRHVQRIQQRRPNKRRQMAAY